MGVRSIEEFLGHKIAQDIAFERYTISQYKDLINFYPYIGKTIGGVKITLSGLLAGTHLVGPAGVEEFLRSNGENIRTDKSKKPVPVTRYLRNFGGADFIYDKQINSFVDGPAAVGRDSMLEPYTKHAGVHRHISRAAVWSVAPVRQAGQVLKRLRGATERAGISSYWPGSPAAGRGRNGALLPGMSGAAVHIAISQQLAKPAVFSFAVNSRAAWKSAPVGCLGQNMPTGNGGSAYQRPVDGVPVVSWKQRNGRPGVGDAPRHAGRTMAWASVPSIAPRQQPTPLSPAAHGRGQGSAAMGNYESRRVWPHGINAETDGLARGQGISTPVLQSFGSTAGRRGDAAAADEHGTGKAGRNVEALLDDARMGRTLERLLSRQARLPPSGAAGFDPRLSPAWAGLKLPG